MATHSSVLAWRIPGTGEPGGIFQARVLEWGAIAFSKGLGLGLSLGLGHTSEPESHVGPQR